MNDPGPAGRDIRARFAVAAMPFLILFAVYYLGVGFRFLLFAPSPPVTQPDGSLTRSPGDLWLRWVDQRYVFAGLNPFDVFFANKGGADREAYERATGRPAAPLPDLGVPWDEGYPPWSFALGAACFWPPWPAVRIYWAAINAAALVAIVAWAAGRAGDRRLAWLLAGSVLALSSYGSALAIGQTSVLIAAFLLWSLALAERGHDGWAGLLLALAMFKPTTTAPFLFCMLAAGRFRALAVAAVYLIAASGLAWARTATSPVEMLGQMMKASAQFVGDGGGPINWAIAAGIGPARATKVVALTVVAVTALILLAIRRRPLALLYAVTAVGCRLWTYHRNNDDNVLILVLVPLGVLAWEARRPGPWLAYLAVGLSLWVPARFVAVGGWRHAPAGNAAQVVIWLAALASLLAWEVGGRRRLGPTAPAPARGSGVELEVS